MEADRLNCDRGLLLAAGVVWFDCVETVDDGCVACSVAVAVTPLVAGEAGDSSVGREAPDIVGRALGFAVFGEMAAPLPPSLLPNNTFKLFNSVPSSFKRFSFPSRAPSRALGIASFNDLTSSLMRRVSSSLRREAFFRSATRFSTSRRAVSRRSVRDSSAAFRAAVSVETCSIKAKARLNCSSMFSLSCSSCGGVGGAIRGVI